MPQVQVIQPIQQQPKRLRVAAYARVSSDSEDQLNSLAVQVDYYTHLIQENPNWEFAGIYTDEGITGTSTKRREQFNRLMDDCRAGLIDRVLVKSASRFARNTADALSSVRELKSLGVTVAFEKEGFDTETSNGEMLLSMICAVAQEESLSISQNMKWGIHKRMRAGNYITNATPFGYTQINHQLVPEKNNAMIVNDIFKSYLSGMSINEIAEHLNTIYPKENSKWNPRTIHAILRNEKYIGDSLYQKTYTTDEPCTVTDFEIPKKYGLRQTIGDTNGIGGIFRALRTIPVMLDFAKDMEEVCPDALFINYTNPMSMLTLAMGKATPIKTIGLCHSHQECIPGLFGRLGLPQDHLNYKIAGINHMAWLLEITRNGEDLYPLIKQKAKEGPIYDTYAEYRKIYRQIPQVEGEFSVTNHDDMVRFELMQKFGYYVTESSEHSAEYYPYFIKKNHPELIEQFNIPLDEYPRRCRIQIEDWEALAERLVNDENLTHTCK